MALIPSHDLVDFLSGTTLNGVVYTAGTNLFAGTEEDGENIPDACIFLYDDGGVPPMDRMGVKTSDHEVSVSGIVRGAAGDEFNTVKVGAEMRLYLHGCKPSGYDIVLADQSLGLHLTDDAKKRPRWKYTLRSRYEESSLP